MLYKRTIQMLDNGEWKTTDFIQKEFSETYAEVWEHSLENADKPVYDDEGRLVKVVTQSFNDHRTIREFIYG